MSNIAEAPKEKLREIVARIGDRILEDPERCEGLLKDHCGEHRREVSALVGALQERVPMELRSSWQSAMTPEAMRARLVQRLQDHRGLAPEVADWAVDAWSYALGVGLARTSDRLASHVVGAPGLPPPPAAQQQWVGSQVMTPNSPLPPPPPPAMMQPQTPPPSGSALKAAVAVGVLAIAGYFAMPLINPPTPKTVEKPCVNRAADGSCLDGSSSQKVVPPQPQPQPQPVPQVLSTGTALSVRIGEGLLSSTATTGQYVNATLTAPAMVNGKQVLAAGAKVVLQVSQVDAAGRIAGVPQIRLSMYQVEAGGRNYLASSTAFVAKGPSRTVNTVKKAGIGAAVGCGVGAVVGVFTRKTKKGCGVGAAGGAGAGTVVAATNEIKPAVISQGSVIQFTLLRPLTIG